MTGKLFDPSGSSTENLDLSRWPRWMREALSHQPVVTAAKESVNPSEPPAIDRARIRILSRMPSRP